MDTSSVGSVFTKKNVDDVFALSKLKNVNSLKNEESTSEKEDVPEKKEEVKEEIKKEEKPREQQLTMSDFFEEFKI